MTNGNKKLEEKLVRDIQRKFDKNNDDERSIDVEASSYDESSGTLAILINYYSGCGPSTHLESKRVVAYQGSLSKSVSYENDGTPEYAKPVFDMGLFERRAVIGYHNGKICAFRGIKITSVLNNKVCYELFPTEDSAKDYRIPISSRIKGELLL